MPHKPLRNKNRNNRNRKNNNQDNNNCGNQQNGDNYLPRWQANVTRTSANTAVSQYPPDSSL